MSKIILIRHGESAGNADKSAYETLADCSIPLTPLGIQQAASAAQTLDVLIAGERAIFYVSPYLRTQQTAIPFKWLFSESLFFEDARIREIEMYNGLVPLSADSIEEIKDARNSGRFFRRLTGGENGASVYDRCASFYSTMKEDARTYSPSYQVVISHAYTMRVLRCIIERLPCSYVDSTDKPSNCEIIKLF